MAAEVRDSQGQYRLKDLGPSEQSLECPYRELLGALLYVSVTTRPDIAYSVGCLARFGERHGMIHWISLVRILKYLAQTQDLGLEFKRRVHQGEVDTSLEAYSDSDYAGCPNTRRSVSGYAIFLGGNLIAWHSRKQSVVALSSTDAEYVACTTAVTNIIDVRRVIQHVGLTLPGPTLLRVDNQSAIVMIQRRRFEPKLKHIDVRYHFIKQEIGKSVTVEYVQSQFNLADLFTKALPQRDFVRLRSGLNLVNVNVQNANYLRMYAVTRKLLSVSDASSQQDEDA